MSNNIRKPSVAGLFYPEYKGELKDLLENISFKEKSKIDLSYASHHIIGGIVPHAAMIYSGYQAFHFFHILKNAKQPIDTVVILNPNHRGVGPGVALDSHSVWGTPLGTINIDDEFYKALDIPVSTAAHDNEHSGEVMVPFLQYYLPESIKIAPVSMFDQSYDSSYNLAQKLINAADKTGKRIVIIASSDFSHFVKPSEGSELDNLVCEKIEELDAEGVYHTVMENNISVCGYGPIMTLIEYSKTKHPKAKTQILHRGHSGEIAPSTRVVNYICTLFFEPNAGN